MAGPHSGSASASAAIQIKESAVDIHELAPLGLALVITILGKRWF
ncbi:MAG: hypothetical protein ABSC46_06865 [Candidatus Limnocylindrales bacterium]